MTGGSVETVLYAGSRLIASVRDPQQLGSGVIVVPIADLVELIVGPDLPVAFEAYDGSRCGPEEPPAKIVVRSPDAIRRIVTAPGELGIGRAYVAGDIDLEGDVFAALELRRRFSKLRFTPTQWRAAFELVGLDGLRPLPPPPEEAHLRGRRHSRARDAAAVSHHYDVSNAFYRIVLGPSMTYSCAVWESPDVTLEAAQTAKYELVCRKLGLERGMRLLDVGCGWGGMVMHAAQHHGVRAVGVTLSRRQAELAAKRVAEAGLGDQVDIRLQDYRDVQGERYDAISSIGMFEHVGLAQLGAYFRHLFDLLPSGGRLLNHAIGRAPPTNPHPLRRASTRFRRGGFIDRYVFPDGELHELGSVISALQCTGFEARHMENLREHYALTLRAWVRNLETGWDDAVAEAGEARARIWRLYMAGSAVSFEDANIQVHQVLALKPDRGASGMPLRPAFS
ncbi:MAG: class I SAM-dependent methyltransferase [Acidimicrobiia bacterium]